MPGNFSWLFLLIVSVAILFIYNCLFLFFNFSSFHSIVFLVISLLLPWLGFFFFLILFCSLSCLCSSGLRLFFIYLCLVLNFILMLLVFFIMSNNPWIIFVCLFVCLFVLKEWETRLIILESCHGFFYSCMVPFPTGTIPWKRMKFLYVGRDFEAFGNKHLAQGASILRIG